MNAKELVQTIKAKYPDIITAKNAKKELKYQIDYGYINTNPNCFYCVGGAYLLYIGHRQTFPTRYVLYEQFKLRASIATLEPNFYSEVLYKLACEIIESNDRGEFETAWKTLELALEAIYDPTIIYTSKLKFIVSTIPNAS